MLTADNLKTLLHPSVVQRADVIELFGRKSWMICMALAAGDENLRILRRYDLSSSAYETTIQNFLARQKVDCHLRAGTTCYAREIGKIV